jgi:hypothetical protein
MAQKKVLQRVKFGRVSSRVIGTWVLTLMVENGLRTAGATSKVSAPKERAPLDAEETAAMVAGAVDMVAALGWRRLAARIAAEAGIGKKGYARYHVENRPHRECTGAAVLYRHGGA